MASRMNASFDLTCEPIGKINSAGFLFRQDNITEASLPLVLLQISIVNSFTALFDFLLKPFGQFSFVPHLLGGIAIGPSCLSRYDVIKDNIFTPSKSKIMVNAFEHVGLIFLFFMLSMQIDFNVLRKPGKLAFAIGISALILPIMITVTIALFMKDFTANEELQATLPMVAFLESTTSFHQILLFLKDLKLLNSELGRIALVSSVISGMGNWIYLTFVVQMYETANTPNKLPVVFSQICHLLMIVVIVFAFRPLILWMMRKTPERSSLKESHVAIMIILILCCALYTELIGLHPGHGAVLLGMATPDSPPMGSSLLNKFECFVWGVLLPGFMINIGKRVNLFNLKLATFFTVSFIIIAASLGKFISVLVPSLYFNMPARDAVPLGLILSGRGIFDVLFFYRAKQAKLVSDETFGIMVATTIVHSAVIAPIVRAVYDSSKRYMAYNRRTIEHNRQQGELRVVACVHELEYVIPIINILEISNPSRESPLAVYVLNLEELVGRTMPLFISHKYNKTSLAKAKPTRASRIVNVFHQYEQQREEVVVVQCYTSLAPYSTMHEDIITLAHEKCTTLVIIPFEEINSPYIRAMNKNVLENAPCSVAIFIGRGILAEAKFLHTQPTISVCVVFLGGCDDREALAYGTRMSENPKICLTVLRCVEGNPSISNLTDKRHDLIAVSNFRINTYENKLVTYKEESLLGVSETTNMLHLIKKDYDLILVGRRHDDDCTLLQGLSEWSEIKELGVIGDILAPSDIGCRAALMVVQQQVSVVQEMIDSSVTQ